LIKEKSICIIGIEKGGHSLQESLHRNFGCSKSEGYRKSLRVIQLAEKFSIPILFLIDTPGAYPGIESEERHISLMISKNIKRMGFLNIPTMSLVLGEGGSGGALAIGVTDYILMMQYSYYSVISPEGCSSIL
jgi:acetyl-CoA carboxylase carboxyl transferase subunit alpha